MALLPSCTEAVTVGVWGHEAGNFSVVLWIDTQSHHVRRQHINLKRPYCNLQRIVFGPGSKQAVGEIEASWQSKTRPLVTALSPVAGALREPRRSSETQCIMRLLLNCDGWSNKLAGIAFERQLGAQLWTIKTISHTVNPVVHKQHQ